jgi:hypothetical protein
VKVRHYPAPGLDLHQKTAFLTLRAVRVGRLAISPVSARYIQSAQWNPATQIRPQLKKLPQQPKSYVFYCIVCRFQYIG